MWVGKAKWAVCVEVALALAGHAVGVVAVRSRAGRCRMRECTVAADYAPTAVFIGAVRFFAGMADSVRGGAWGFEFELRSEDAEFLSCQGSSRLLFGAKGKASRAAVCQQGDMDRARGGHTQYGASSENAGSDAVRNKLSVSRGAYVVGNGNCAGLAIGLMEGVFES